MRPWDIPDKLRQVLQEQGLTWSAELCARCDHSSIFFPGGVVVPRDAVDLAVEDLKATGVIHNVVFRWVRR